MPSPPILLLILIISMVVARRRVRRFVQQLWNDIWKLLALSLSALAVTAMWLNSLGFHPTSLVGSIPITLVMGIIGAVLLRWGETRH